MKPNCTQISPRIQLIIGHWQHFPQIEEVSGINVQYDNNLKFGSNTCIPCMSWLIVASESESFLFVTKWRGRLRPLMVSYLCTEEELVLLTIPQLGTNYPFSLMFPLPSELNVNEISIRLGILEAGDSATFRYSLVMMINFYLNDFTSSVRKFGDAHSRKLS